YDVLEMNGWSLGLETRTDVTADVPLLDKIADGASSAGASQVTISVEPGSFTGPIVVSPGVPMRVDQPVGLVTTTGGYLARIDRQGMPPSPYSVTSLVGRRGEAAGEWSISALRAAGATYPNGLERYRSVAKGLIGPNARALEERVVSESGG